MSIVFANPWWLALLLALPLFYVVGRERLLRLPRGARRAIYTIRIAVTTSVVLALSQPILIRQADNLAVVFAMDASDSVPQEARAQQRAWIENAIKSAPPGDMSAVIAFGGDTTIQRGFGDVAQSSVAAQPRGDATNLSGALRLAQAIFPVSGARRVILLSDGQQNEGDAEEEARVLARQGIQVSAVGLALPPDTTEVLVQNVDAPQFVRLGDNYVVSVDVYSTYQTQATLEISVNNTQVTEEVVQLNVGPNRFTVNLVANEQGFRSYTARIRVEGDTFSQNNVGWGYTVVKDAGSVLVISSQPGEAAPLVAGLTSAGISVEEQPPSFIPPNLTPMKKYDSLVLVNVPGNSLSLDQMKTITNYVRALGRGVVAIGGDSSFSLGNYANTPLADMLPVTMSVPGGQERGSLGIVLVVDKSGSMDGREDGVTKIAMAREAADKAVGILSSGDVVGIVAFDTTSQFLVPPQRIGNEENRVRISDLIQRLNASGGTNIYQALSLALDAMRNVRAQYRHIILFSDGQSQGPTSYDDLIREMNGSRITLSTIAIGSDADTALMQDLAKLGQGRYYLAPKAADVPTITMRETRIASGATSIEGEFKPNIASQSPLLQTFSNAQLPDLDGYVVTVPKEGAQIALSTVRDEPLLAHWQYGLGRAVAWTSDITRKWASQWLNWNQFPKFWAQTVRWSMRDPADPNLHISTSSEGKRVTINVDVVDDDGMFQDLLDMRGTVQTAQGMSDELKLAQTGPGHYETTFTVPSEGAYKLSVYQKQGNQTVKEETAGFVVPYPAEYRAFGANTRLLSQLMTGSGGHVLTDPKEAFARDISFAGQDRLPLWPYLLMLAALLFPFDVGIRRLKLSPSYIRRKVWMPVSDTAGQIKGSVVSYLRSRTTRRRRGR